MSAEHIESWKNWTHVATMAMGNLELGRCIPKIEVLVPKYLQFQKFLTKAVPSRET